MGADETSFVVAIDGPAGAGKSTAARSLSQRLGYTFLDTGALYRAVALVARRRGVGWSEGGALGELTLALDLHFEPDGAVNRVFVGDAEVTQEIREHEISEGASRVSAHPEVRAALLEVQRAIGRTARVVAEGRDTGTVVFPDADAKFFLTAPAIVRARRRAAELAAAGRVTDLAEVLRDIETRDARDSTRPVAPLRKAADAIEIDSGALRPGEVVDRMADLVEARAGAKAPRAVTDRAQPVDAGRTGK
jgi:cytidylate kinase